jgi:hypothetical protein
VPDRSRLLLPTGDGVCVALLNVTSPSVHLQVALDILRRLDEQNRSAVAADTLSLRVGVNGGTDHLIDDINGRRNLAGSAINLAQRIMSMADPNQVMVGRPVYDDLVGNEEFAEWFREYDAVVKHSRRHTIYQVVANERPYLDVQPPSRVGLTDLHDLFDRAKSETFLRSLTVRQLAELDGAVLRAHVVSAARGDAESYVHAFERARALPPVWRKDYKLDVEIEAFARNKDLRRTRLAWEWSYVNHSGEDLPAFEQRLVHTARYLPDDVTDEECFRVIGTYVNRKPVKDIRSELTRDEHERVFTGSIAVPLSADPADRSTKLRYVWEAIERRGEPLVASVLTPVKGIEVSLRCPRAVAPRLYVMGMPNGDEPTDPVPFTRETSDDVDGPDRYRWEFDGWLLENQGFLLMLGVPSP